MCALINVSAFDIFHVVSRDDKHSTWPWRESSGTTSLSRQEVQYVDSQRELIEIRYVVDLI